MTPDLLNKISSIVNKELIPQSLSELSDPEGKYQSVSNTARKEQENKKEDERTPGQRQVQNQVDNDFKTFIKNDENWKDVKVKSNSKYKYVENKSITEMPENSYMRIDKNENIPVKLNNKRTVIPVRAGNYIFKDSDGQTRCVTKNTIDQHYAGTISQILTHSPGTRQVALYQGAKDLQFSSGSQTRTLRKNQYLVKDGGNLVNMNVLQFKKHFEDTNKKVTNG
jgi:hypothetical protein